VIAKMNVLFDKAMYEKGRSLDTNSNKIVDEKDEGKSIEKAIKESLASGKVGSLSVDPNFLEFEPLASECNKITDKNAPNIYVIIPSYRHSCSSARAINNWKDCRLF
jgi:hypothetical protein